MSKKIKLLIMSITVINTIAFVPTLAKADDSISYITDNSVDKEMNVENDNTIIDAPEPTIEPSVDISEEITETIEGVTGEGIEIPDTTQPIGDTSTDNNSGEGIPGGTTSNPGNDNTIGEGTGAPGDTSNPGNDNSAGDISENPWDAPIDKAPDAPHPEKVYPAPEPSIGEFIPDGTTSNSGNDNTIGEGTTSNPGSGSSVEDGTGAGDASSNPDSNNSQSGFTVELPKVQEDNKTEADKTIVYKNDEHQKEEPLNVECKADTKKGNAEIKADSLSADLSVKEKVNKTKNSNTTIKTSDSSKLYIYLTVMGLSIAGMLSMVKGKLRKHI